MMTVLSKALKYETLRKPNGLPLTPLDFCLFY